MQRRKDGFRPLGSPVSVPAGITALGFENFDFSVFILFDLRHRVRFLRLMVSLSSF